MLSKLSQTQEDKCSTRTLIRWEPEAGGWGQRISVSWGQSFKSKVKTPGGWPQDNVNVCGTTVLCSSEGRSWYVSGYVYFTTIKKIGFDYYAVGGKAFADGRWAPSVQTRHLRRTAPVEKLLAFSML